ncbi:MAG: peptidoglycan DD-metalloendopeptidase family protein [Bacteroidetes bacterium]|nr:peptidoglycan DD-metalloendopeptidase family protein [Bacteroidota bacterium]
MPGVVYLRTPLEAMPNMRDYSFFHIPFTVDDDPTSGCSDAWGQHCYYPYEIRTFDGCTGTEFQFGRRGFNVMDEKIARVTAAADGIIVAKVDGNFDRNCYGVTGPENYVALEHSDGSRTYYYNLKNGDLNPKPIGGYVSEGELIGYPGASGIGSGISFNVNFDERVSLFFELRDNANTVINPFNDVYNFGRPSRWRDSTYLYFNYTTDPSVIHLKTFKHAPVNSDNCGTTLPTYNDHFNPGDSIYYEFALKNYDVMLDSFLLDIYNPIGVPVMPTYVRNKGCATCSALRKKFINYYLGFQLPANGLMIPGTYKIILSLHTVGGSDYFYNHYITVGCQSDYFPTANISGESGLIAGNNIVTSQQFYNTSRVKYVAGNQIILNPGFVAHEGSDVFLYNEPCVVPPRLSDEDSESPDQEMEKLLIAPNPARDFITVKIKDYNSKATFKIYNSTLQLVKVLNVENAAGQIISLAEFENGIYFIDAQANEWSYKSKFVVNK